MERNVVRQLASNREIDFSVLVEVGRRYTGRAVVRGKQTWRAEGAETRPSEDGDRVREGAADDEIEVGVLVPELEGMQ